MSLSKPTGMNSACACPIKIVEVCDDVVKCYPEKLKQVLLNHKDVRICVLPVAGAYRKGKSFLLSLFVKIFTSDGDWREDRDTPLSKLFQWQSGTTRKTTGIDVWSEPIPVTLKSGEKIHVLLMDTQGTFDHKSSTKESATVFALSTLLSSILIYNLQKNIQEDDLQHLQLWMEYGKLALQNNNSKPFQKLLFLVRDWESPYENPYGGKGGQTFIDKKLEISENQAQELKNLRYDIKACFENITCFLMPHPGLNVPSDPRFDGRLQDVEDDFVESLTDLVDLLSDKYICAKQINGIELTGENLISLFEGYSNLFKDDTLPEPKSIFETTANANNMLAVDKAVSIFKTNMDKQIKDEHPMDTQEFERILENAKQQAMKEFTTTRKMGDETIIKEHEKKLETRINELEKKYISQNKQSVEKLNKSIKETALSMYKEEMDEIMQRCDKWIDTNSLTQEHKLKQRNATKYYAKLCKMGDKDFSKEILTHLLTDIEEEFERICKLNEVKGKSARLDKVSEAQEFYKNEIRKFLNEQDGCVDPSQLHNTHKRVKERALAMLQGIGSEEEHQLKTFIDEQLKEFEKLNKDKAKRLNFKVYQEAEQMYRNEMDKYQFVCTDSTELKKGHESAKNNALNHFEIHRQLKEDRDTQECESKLMAQLTENFDTIERRNEEKAKMENENALAKAKDKYRSEMRENCNENQGALKPDVLDDIHNRIQQSCMAYYDSNTKLADTEHSKSQRSELCKYIQGKFQNLKENNEKQAKDMLRSVKDREIEKYRKEMLTILNDGAICIKQEEFEEKHTRLKMSAMDALQEHQYFTTPEFEKPKTELESEITEMYDKFKIQNKQKSTNLQEKRYRDAKDKYIEDMNRKLSGVYLESSKMDEEHQTNKEAALDFYDQCSSHGITIDKEMKEKLGKDIDNEYESFKRRNVKNKKSFFSVDTLKQVFTGAATGMAHAATSRLVGSNPVDVNVFHRVMPSGSNTLAIEAGGGPRITKMNDEESEASTESE